MEIKDLEARQGKVDLVIELAEKGDVREFEKFGKKGRVCSAKAKDASGEIILSLWNEQIDEVKVGDTIQISNGYVSEFQGEKQLSTGKFGKLEIVKKAEGAEQNASSGEQQETEQKDAAEKPPTVFTNAPPEQFKEEMEDLSKKEDVSEDPVKDEEYRV